MVCRFLLIILSLIALSGCADGTCLDADDFGFAHFVVPARYSSSDLQGQNDNQVAPWLNTGYTVNGQPLVIVVKNWNAHDNANTADQLSAWCPWYGGNSGATGLSALFGNLLPPDATSAISSVFSDISPVGSFGNALATMCQNLAVCQWSAGGMCTNTVDAQITNAPCILTKGVGLYALITAPGVDPNSSIATNVNPAMALSPAGIALHMGDPHVEYNLYDVDVKGGYNDAGGVVYNYNGHDPVVYNNGSLYFKILDKHYGDNSGQYLVTVKSGLDKNVLDPIQFVTNMVAQYIFGSSAFLNNPGDSKNQSALSALFNSVNVNSQGIVESMYQSLIQNPFYQNSVRALLSLYVMFTGLYYLAGLLHLTTKEIIARIIKIAIIGVLLDPSLGWSFFHDNLFVFFIEGVQQIIALIREAAATGPGADSIIALMLAPQTLTKLFALLFSSWFGVIYIILYFLIFCFLISVTLRAAVLYLNCLIIIGMIIIMGPIFICFMLFSWTKGLFENWLRQLISYALQPIILITSIAFVSILVRHEIYVTLGFPVCKKYFLSSVFDTVDPSGNISSIFSWWFPAPMDGSFSNDLVTIPVPEAHNVLDSQGNPTGVYCGAYSCSEPRYVQLPFLDPNNPADMVRKNNFFEGSFTQIIGIIYILVLCYLMNRFNESAVTIARALTDTSGNNTSMDKATHAPSFTDVVKAPFKAAKFAGRLALMGATRSMSKGGGVGARNDVAVDGSFAGASATDYALTRSNESQQIVKGGLFGSKDDGSGTKNVNPKVDPLAEKGFETLSDAKNDLTKERVNEPKRIEDGASVVTKKVAKDDFDVRLSNKKFETAKPSQSLEEAKANLKAQALTKKDKSVEVNKLATSMVGDILAKGVEKNLANGAATSIVGDIIAKGVEKRVVNRAATNMVGDIMSGALNQVVPVDKATPPPLSSASSDVNPEISERASPKSSAPSVDHKNVEVINERESLRNDAVTSSTAQQEVLSSEVIEKSRPVLQDPPRVIREDSVINERTIIKSDSIKQDMKVSVETKNDSVPPLPNANDVANVPPPPPRPANKETNYNNYTEASRAKERSKKVLNSSSRKMKESSSAPQLGSKNMPLSPSRSSVSDLSSVGSRESVTTRTTAASRANAAGGIKQKEDIEVRNQKEAKFKESLSPKNRSKSPTKKN